MKTFEVILPIAGHAYLIIQAETKKEAIGQAFDEVALCNIEEWEALTEFNRGKVCYCPQPWEVTAEEVDIGC